MNLGGGSAGSSLAASLSQSKQYSILVLEAGGAPSPIHSLPTIAFTQTNDPAIDWRYMTVPQKQAAFGLNNNTVRWPTGKVLGGSSQLNAMMYLRGNVQGFDEVAAKTGDSRWKTANILKYYKGLENYDGWFSKNDHGSGGPINVERPVLSKFTENIMKAGEELGYRIRDPNENGPYTEGFSKMDLHLHNGRRSDAFHEFLRPAMQTNRNLIVRKFSRVTRILINSDSEAYAVEYLRHGRRFIAKANMDIILSSGGIRSAQLLLLSGIGPKEHLREHGIRTIMNLPVGQKLKDKYGALVGPFLVSEGQSTVLDRDWILPDLFRWISTGTGPVRTSLSEGTWAIVTEEARKRGKVTKPDIHAYVLSISFPEEARYVLQNTFNFKPETYDFLSRASNMDSFFQLVTLNAPDGYGKLRLRDADPLSDPVLDPQYLEHEGDSRALLEGVKFAVKIVENTTAMQKIDGRLMPEHFPGCEKFEFKSDQYFECIMRHTTLTAFKYAGANPIGKGLSDPDAVVDSHLRVLGIKRLRVVDGSIIQLHHSSMNDVTCRMIGQFAADIIRDDWKLS
ncbi:Glucose dehydrogenase [FAD, quinone] [Orchesella cincta]|uniref:Glucose dehydrogenase [FAD, quinone] n=1 Tax=Orchesella cincta TaxID=48709 RepID=A0A1D2MTF0_ORCCI|nr:Glucose dehydrogenase [FAD, quinone] [Orchesella cincta]